MEGHDRGPIRDTTPAFVFGDITTTLRSQCSLDPGGSSNQAPQFSEFPLLVCCVHLATINDASHGLVSVFVHFLPFVTSIKGRKFRAFRTGISGVKRNLWDPTGKHFTPISCAVGVQCPWNGTNLRIFSWMSLRYRMYGKRSLSMAWRHS